MTLTKALVRPRVLRRLLPPGTHVLVGASGGADSQALLHLLATERQALEIEVSAIGVDHGLRPGAARELDVAASLAGRLGVEFAVAEVDVDRSGNLMAQARRARHRAIAEHARSSGAPRIALGHTASDVAETVLMNLSRGASLRGASVLPARRGRVVRPLLDCTRDEVRAYCVTHRIQFVDDPTNDDLSFKRPLIRHAVLPSLRAVSPQADRAIARFARDARVAERSLERQARKFLSRHMVRFGPWAGGPRAVPVERLRRLDLALRTRVVRALIKRAGIKVNRDRIQRIMGALGTSGFLMHAGGGLAGVDREHLFVLRDIYYSAGLLDGTVVPPWGAQLHVHETHEGKIGIPDPSTGVAFDADALHHALLVRSWSRGDTIRCFGHEGRAKVGNLFTNAKIPRPLREAWPIVTHGDEIVWVVGIKRASFAPVVADTKRAKVIELDAALMASAP